MAKTEKFYTEENKRIGGKKEEKEYNLRSFYSAEEVDYSSFYVQKKYEDEIGKTKKIVDIQKIEQKVLLSLVGGILLGLGVEPYLGFVGILGGLAVGIWVNSAGISKVVEYWKRNIY